MSEQQPKEVPQTTLAQLTAQLSAAHIDYSGWGTTIPGSKPIEKLLKEVNNGDCKLVPTPEGGLVRQVEQVAVYVYARDNQGRLFKLREDRQVFPGGRERRREMDVSYREKLDQRNEGFYKAAKRGLKEELPKIFRKLQYNPNVMYEGIHHIGTHRPAEILNEDSRPGYIPSYPGLPNSSLEHRYTMLITSKAYNPKGYRTNEDGKVSYFTWTEVGPDEPFLPITAWEKMTNQQQAATIESMKDRISSYSGIPQAVVTEYLFLTDRFNQLFAMGDEALGQNDSLELEFALTDFRIIDLKRAYPQLTTSSR